MTEEYHRSMVFSIHRFIMRLPFIVSLYGKPQFDLSYLYASTNPVQEVELLADTYQLNQSERGNVLRSLFMGRDLSRYGMMNAITDASKLAASYEIYYYEQLQK